MSDVIAKPVVKNKFWIVEDHGKKVATIQAIEDGGFAYVQDHHREIFPTIKMLKDRYNIDIIKPSKSATAGKRYEVHGYPTAHKPHNEIYDVQKKLPIFTKSTKSKSFFCAGYYVIKFSNNWVKAFCPKSITLNRYDFKGPFATQEEQQEILRKLNG